MRWIVTVERIDGELWVDFPDELIERQNLAEGDKLQVVEHPDGIVLRRVDASAGREGEPK
jgi:bifunctional DNA-binding transcriptional regulator/antitoxin component of YhaV-PrlF toxin-antitoxin module